MADHPEIEGMTSRVAQFITAGTPVLRGLFMPIGDGVRKMITDPRDRLRWGIFFLTSNIRAVSSLILDDHKTTNTPDVLPLLEETSAILNDHLLLLNKAIAEHRKMEAEKAINASQTKH